MIKREGILQWIKGNFIIFILLCFVVMQTCINMYFVFKIARLQNILKFLQDFLGSGAYNV